MGGGLHNPTAHSARPGTSVGPRSLDATPGDQLRQRKQELLAELDLPKAKPPVRATTKKPPDTQAAAH